MISPLELCQIIESAFLPTRCVCKIDGEGRMTVNLYPSQKGHASFFVDGIRVDTLSSIRAIANLVSELRLGFSQKGLPEHSMCRAVRR